MIRGAELAVRCEEKSNMGTFPQRNQFACAMMVRNSSSHDELGLASAHPDDKFQLSRTGRFVADRKDRSATGSVFDLAVSSKESWAKRMQVRGPSSYYRSLPAASIMAAFPLLMASPLEAASAQPASDFSRRFEVDPIRMTYGDLFAVTQRVRDLTRRANPGSVEIQDNQHKAATRQTKDTNRSAGFSQRVAMRRNCLRRQKQRSIRLRRRSGLREQRR